MSQQRCSLLSFSVERELEKKRGGQPRNICREISKAIPERKGPVPKGLGLEALQENRHRRSHFLFGSTSACPEDIHFM